MSYASLLRRWPLLWLTDWLIERMPVVPLFFLWKTESLQMKDIYFLYILYIYIYIYIFVVWMLIFSWSCGALFARSTTRHNIDQLRMCDECSSCHWPLIDWLQGWRMRRFCIRWSTAIACSRPRAVRPSSTTSCLSAGTRWAVGAS